MTEQQNDIQRARDVLERWREDSTAGRWIVDLDRGQTLDSEDSPEVYSESNADSVVLFSGGAGGNDIRLIVGTAGNPDLLDAIDALLSAAVDDDRVWIDDRDAFAPRIAAAIIAADERMNA